MNHIKFLKRPDVQAMTSLSRSSIYALMEQGKFPKQIKLSERSVAWIESEIQDWLKSRVSASRQEGAI